MENSCYTISGLPTAENINFTINDICYRWEGGFGCIISSFETGVKQGDVRMIANIPFFAFYLTKKFESVGIFRCKYKTKVYWSIPNQHLTIEWIRDFKKAILGL